MNKDNQHITVFEHESIRFDKGENRISEDQFKALQQYYGDGVPYFSLCYNGVQFNEYVGVIQIGCTLIEVIPKTDRNSDSETKNKWRNILIGMMKAVHSFDIKSTSEGHLKVKPNTILDLYFEMFIKEVEYLLNAGLLKKYREKESNVTVLKGRLQFGKHIQQNLIHQERFYVRFTTYDVVHNLHFILYKTIRLLKQINTNSALHGRIGALLLNFPEMPDLKITASTFEKLVFTRKTQSYKKAIDIAKLLLLQYHPDVSEGKNNVLALMFDMNKLWEQFVYASLRKYKSQNTTITAQATKFFWKPENGYRSKIIPDIVLNKNREDCVVLDTKWKNLNGSNPSPDDLRQMYVYHEYFNAKRVALIYPGAESSTSSGAYLNRQNSEITEKECSIISLSVEPKIKQWQENIYKYFESWMNLHVN